MKKKDLKKEIFNKITTYLVRKKPELSNEQEDGRINSAVSEDIVIKELKKLFKENYFKKNNLKLIVPTMRSWYDFAVEKEDDSNFFIPVNIKISECKANDNLNCKLGIYYALTGIVPDFKNEIPWDEFFSYLKRDLNKNKDKDYYFLIVNKKDNKDVFVTSLKTLSKLTPNGNNLPFQSRWNDNRVPVNRTHKEAVKFILDTLNQSLTKRCSPKYSFDKNFPKY